MFNALKLVQNLAAVLSGKLLAGIISGVANVLFQDQLSKLVPEEASQTYGIATNMLLNVGVLSMSIISSAILPAYDNQVPKELMENLMFSDEMWRIVYSTSVFASLLAGILILCFFRDPAPCELTQDIVRIEDELSDIAVHLSSEEVQLSKTRLEALKIQLENVSQKVYRFDSET